jgi:hypothetical protein
MISSFCLIWAKRYSRLLRQKLVHVVLSASGDEGGVRGESRESKVVESVVEIDHLRSKTGIVGDALWAGF